MNLDACRFPPHPALGASIRAWADFAALDEKFLRKRSGHFPRNGYGVGCGFVSGEFLDFRDVRMGAGWDGGSGQRQVEQLLHGQSRSGIRSDSCLDIEPTDRFISAKDIKRVGEFADLWCLDADLENHVGAGTDVDAGGIRANGDPAEVFLGKLNAHLGRFPASIGNGEIADRRVAERDLAESEDVLRVDDKTGRCGMNN